MIDKMQTRTFSVNTRGLIGITYYVDADFTLMNNLDVFYDDKVYEITIEYVSQYDEYLLMQSMGENTNFEDKGNYSLFSDMVCIALEESGNIVFSLEENYWYNVFKNNLAIKYYGIFNFNI